MAGHDGVEPPATTSATGVRAVLVPTVDEEVAELVGQLGRERTSTHSGDVGLGDTNDRREVTGSESRANRSTTGNRVR